VEWIWVPACAGLTGTGCLMTTTLRHRPDAKAL
jgi:hypothetical protein